MDSKVDVLLDNVQKSASIKSIKSTLSDIAEDYGYDCYLIASIPRPVEMPKECIMLTNFRDKWIYRYLTYGYVDHDPVIPRLLTSTMPFEWRELSKRKPLSKKERMVMEEAQELGGLRSGFSIPVHGPIGAQETVTFGGSQDIELNSTQRRELHLLGIYTVQRVKELLGHTKKDHPSLAKREIECLKWASYGKTSWETAEILGIQVTTVDSYLNGAMKKLGSTNRVQAVAEALRLKLIN